MYACISSKYFRTQQSYFQFTVDFILTFASPFISVYSYICILNIYPHEYMYMYIKKEFRTHYMYKHTISVRTFLAALGMRKIFPKHRWRPVGSRPSSPYVYIYPNFFFFLRFLYYFFSYFDSSSPSSSLSTLLLLCL